MRFFYTAILLLIMPIASWAQTGNVGIGTSNPEASAILDVSSSSKGLLIPRLTTTQRDSITSPAMSLLVFDTDLKDFMYWNGSMWSPFDSKGSGIVYHDSLFDGDGTMLNPLKLSQNGALNGQILKWNGSNWDVADDSTHTHWNTADSQSICYTEGFIGIGTCAPEALLHLENLNGDPQMKLSTLQHNFIVGIDETDGNFYIGKDFSGTLKQCFTIDSICNVGFGTETPLSDLHIHRDEGDVQIRLSRDNLDYQYIVGIDETDGSFVLSVDSMNGHTSPVIKIDSMGDIYLNSSSSGGTVHIEGKLSVDTLMVRQAEITSLVFNKSSLMQLYKTSVMNLSQTPQDITFDNQPVLGSSFTHSTVNSAHEIEIERTGYYEVNYYVSTAFMSGGNTVRVMAFMKRKPNGSGSFNVLPTSYSVVTHRVSNSEKTQNQQFYQYFEEGDVVKLQAYTIENVAVSTMSMGCGLSMRLVAVD